MNETKLLLKSNDNFIEIGKPNENNNVFEGELIHTSDSRICYMNKIRNNLIHSGDYAIYKNKKLYLKGRIDRIVKINAKIVDLNSLENVTTKFNFFFKIQIQKLNF